MQQETVTGSKIGITIATMAGAVMAMVDISIVNVALSDIRASFGTPLDQIAWVSTGYMMANVVIIPMTGWFQRRFGFRRYFTASLLIFTAASVLCGLAWNMPSLVFFRVLQGLGGGAIMPTAYALLFARYPRQEHGMAGALFSLGAVTGPLLAPTLGGLLIEWASWHWVFLINLPVGLFAAWMSWRHIEQKNFVPARVPVDYPGIALLAVGMASLQYVLEEGNRDDWFESRTITVLAVISVVALITFVVHELETPRPVVDLRVFANRSYSAASAVNFLLGTALFTGGFMFSLYCGTVMHYSALDIGLLFLKATIIQFAIVPIIGKWGHKVDPRILVAFGILVVCLSLGLNGRLTNTADDAALLLPVFVRACSMGFIFVPMTVVALSDLRPEQRGTASGLFSLTRELGGSIGTAWLSMLLTRSTRLNTTLLASHVDVYNPLAQEQLAGIQARLAGRVPDPTQAAYGIMNMRITTQALVRAFNVNFNTLAFVFLCSLVLVVLFKGSNPNVKVKGGH